MTTLTRTSHMLALMLHLLWLDKTHTCCHFCLLHWVSPDDGTLYAGHWTLQAKPGHQPTHLLLHQVQILTSETVHALHNLVNLSWCKIGIFVVCNSYKFRGGLFLAFYEVQSMLARIKGHWRAWWPKQLSALSWRWGMPKYALIVISIVAIFFFIINTPTIFLFLSPPPFPNHNLPLLHQHHRRHHHQHRPCERAIRSAA